MKTLKYMSVCLLVCALFAGCGLNKMVKKQNSVTYTVTPNPMEVYAGKMNIEVQGTFPPKYFRKKATMTVVPTIQAENGSTVSLTPINLKGEKAEGDGKVISYKNGGSFSVKQEVPYNPAYENCTLVGNSTAYLKSKQADFDTVPMAIGTIVTADRVACTPNLTEAGGKSGKSDLMISDHNYNGPKTIEKSAAIYFELNKDNLNMNLSQNKDSKSKEALSAIMPTVSKYNVKEVSVTGWASPEGELKRNSELASNRSKVGEKWFRNEYDKYIKDEAKKQKVKASTLKKDIKVNASDKGEDWDGFIAAVNASNIKDKDQIVNVIKSQFDPDQREQQIRNMIAMYDELDNSILPNLRRAVITAVCEEEKMTDEQISDLAVNHPDTLNANELLYAASMAKDLKTKSEIYKKVMDTYPDDFRGYNDLACVKIALGQSNEAQKLLEKANEIAPKEGLVLNNLGVLALMNGDFKAAASYFDEASKAGVDASYNQGIIAMKNGDYAAASQNMKNVKCDYNVALNYVATKNFAAAKEALDCVSNKTAEEYYLLAVVGARINDADLLYRNLKEACKANADLKTRAAKDVEFYNYRDTDDFKSAIK